MSFSRYISSVNTALREIVLPETQSSRARNAIETSTRLLAAIALALDADRGAYLDTFDLNALPPELKSSLPEAIAPSDRLTLPSVHPVHDVAISEATLPLASAGAKWLEETAWDSSPALAAMASALIKGDQALRAGLVGRMTALEMGFAASASDDGGASDISQAALEIYLRKYLQTDAFTITAFHFVSGRGSRQTVLFSTNGAGGFPERAVIQRDDPRNVFSFTVVNQYPILERLYPAGLAVPQPLLLENDRAVLGAPFMIVSSLPGSPPIDGMNYFDPPPKLPKLALGLATQLALLHSVPVGDLTATLPHSVDGKKNEVWIDVVDRYEGLWKSMAHVPSIAVSAAFSWMRQHIACVENIEVFVHADALLHNLLVEGDEITGVLDWELAHIGHPAEDLGYLKPVLEQMVDWSDFMAAYYAAGGLRMTAEQINFFTLLPLLKLIVQGLQAAMAFESGQSSDIVLAECNASFVPKLMDRLGSQLTALLQTSTS